MVSFYCRRQWYQYATSPRRIHRSFAAIISASRMLSAILELTLGDDLISSRFKRTAAMSDAATSNAELDFFSTLLLGLPRP
jgi:hypothetical protein